MIEIRKSYPIDAYTLIQIHDVVWKSEFYDVLPNGIITDNQKNIEERTNHLKDQIEENNRIFVAIETEKEEIIGYIFYGKSSNSFYNNAVEIREIYILPEYQKKEIGTKLFYSVVEEIKKLGYHTLIIHCPVESFCVTFFEKLGGEKKELINRDIYGYQVTFEVMYFDLDKKEENSNQEWNQLYEQAQEKLYLLNDIHSEIAVLLTEQNHLYLGIGIKNKVCPMESALANMYLNQEKKVSKILILNKKSKPVLPCGKCRDLLIELGQEQAEILFDIGSLKTMTMKELNPYYKKEERI